MFFLTEIDPNAKTKGSRDPLGTLSVWTGFGRRVVGNLTSQTTSLDDFRVLVTGCWLEDQLAGQLDFEGDAFLVWEQLSAYARLTVLDDPPGFRGITRAKRFFAGDRIDVSAERTNQLLTNQRAYGIWGLYRAAGWRCGLLATDTPLVRSESLDLVRQHYLPILEAAWGAGGGELLWWVRSGHELRPGRDRAKLEAIARCISGPLTSEEAALYQATLVLGGASNSSSDCQGALAEALLDTGSEDWFPDSHDLLGMAASSRSSAPLAEALEDIVACEALLAPAAMCFSFLSQQDGTTVSEVARRLCAHFGPTTPLLERRWLERLRSIQLRQPRLLAAVPGVDGRGAQRWLDIAEALHGAEFARLVRLLVQQNEAVSRDRGANVGWVAISADDALTVQLADTSTRLRTPDEVATMWFNSYFIDNLHRMAHQVREAAS